jgi:choline kinase
MKLLIATPAYGGSVFTGFTQSLIYTCQMLTSMNIEFEVKFINNQIVTRARNMLTYLFMSNDTFTHMIFIDADITWSPMDIIKLIQHDLECVIGIYPNKRYIWVNDKLTLNPSSVIIENEIPNDKKLIKVKHAATGFMMLKKSAFERIKHEVDTFVLPGSKNEKITLHNYFDCNVVDHDYLTEDYYFSHLFNKNGGTIFADTSINLLHTGTHVYGELLQEKVQQN